MFVIALAVGPNLVVTSTRHTYTLPWAGLWNLPIARSAEPSRFIVFAVLVLAIALALWLATPAKGKLQLAARWGLGLLAVAVIISDSPTSYHRCATRSRRATQPSRPCTRLTSCLRSSPTACTGGTCARGRPS